MKLTRPLIFTDLETTGKIPSQARICSISVIKVMPDGTEEERYMLINPTIAIPPETTEIHGITDDMVKDKPKFASIAKALFAFIDGCDIGGYNSADYDVIVMAEEFLRCGIQFPTAGTQFPDAMKIFKAKERRNLEAAVKFYLGEDIADAHNAQADNRYAYRVFLAQLEKYKDLSDLSIAEISDFCEGDDKRVDLAKCFIRKPDGKVYFAFGKHKDSKVADVFKTDHSYYKWIMEKSDMTADTKAHAKYFYEAVNPPKK